MAAVKVGLYHVSIQNEPPKTVEQVLSSIGSLPNDKSRARMISDDEPVRARTVDVKDDHCTGELTRIDDVTEMPLSNVAGKEGTLHFGPEDPKPCKHTIFLFDFVSNVLHLDEHRGSVTHAAFARYLQAAGEVQSVAAMPIIRLDAMELFAKQETFSRISVSLAGMGNAAHLRGLGYTDETILNLTNLFHAPKLKLDMRIVSRKQDAEGLARIKETVASLLALPSKQLKKLVVEGKEQNGDEYFPVDLIKSRMRFELELSSRKEDITDADRYRAVREAWTRHRDELRGRFKSKPS